MMTSGNRTNYLESLLQALCREKNGFVVAGGVPGVLHGVERATMDLDIALDLGAETVAKFARLMNELRLVPVAPLPIETLMDPDAIRMMGGEKHALVFSLAGPGTPLRRVSAGQLELAMNRLNHRPRKVLGFKTPAAVFSGEA